VFKTSLAEEVEQFATVAHSVPDPELDLCLIYAALAEAEGIAIGAWDAGAELRREAAEAIAARTEEIAGILADT